MEKELTEVNEADQRKRKRRKKERNRFTSG
jgi:hypothetical protein